MLPLYHQELVPTDFALRLRPAFIAAMTSLVLLVVGKVAIKDWWGAVSLIFVIMVGLFVLSGPYRVNASSALFFSVMGVVAGIFDVISCILYFQHSKYKLMDPKAGTMPLLAQFVFIMSPIAMFVASAVAYAIFADCRDNSLEMQALRQGGFGFQDYDATAWEAERAEAATETARPTPGGGGGGPGAAPPARPADRAAPVVPFSGVGLRLVD